jgi:hypothetical protein
MGRKRVNCFEHPRRKAIMICPECESLFCKECAQSNNDECLYCDPPFLIEIKEFTRWIKEFAKHE